MAGVELPTARELETDVRPLVRIGLLILILGVGSVFLWAATARINSAATASGVVAPFSGRQSVQHLEGGIIRDILVRNGARVQGGDVLIRLDDTRARASFDLLNNRYLNALATQARLIAERGGKDRIQFPAPLYDPKYAGIVESQETLFQSRMNAFRGELELYDERIKELRREIIGTQEQKTASEQQVGIVKEELAMVKPMVDLGYARRTRLLQLESRLVEVLGNIGRFSADIARIEQQIQQVKSSQAQLTRDNLQTINTELRDIQGEISDLNERLRSAEDILVRSDIKAPRSGTVTNLQFSTVGGVIPPGAQVLEIVPQDDKLVIEARVSPNDIDVVHEGLEVNIRVTAFSQRWFAPVKGVVADVSPDRLTDPEGRPYFQAMIEIDSESLAEHEGMILSPGMAAQLEIVTGARTILAYLFAPITDSFDRAFREQ
ncbi:MULTISPECIES: HlyD family type I secretion periplasmic adaptor subunit [Thalassospira]|jgi:HlyD family secretion protein/epimerase transport system membrane fusion protein|uniref:Membrane fusion protein (MFP) family protein n=1 Tax=Thalassospira xiamenensis TaxID=220697 RepID=A0ABR5Y5S9_9PROT|nr:MULTISPECIES: HlyD family type I secretion periplasmic adaptor subunit [Thalassospira]KZD06465.1 secretion protein HylD [Thalassospira xiamenensis]KZD10520.1 secretion protein HylD [Thalassospira xiamenensis]MAB33970.1 HlyD family type I secretion periplasmic adaptor subunit [Thalassospira sp.]MBA05356.1 HlyD family type I secretion periplasmic adaptor subunit [Thalassospira sp.]MCD1592858.1 HlyD family type I secretion periplasmic adaptor subunit [Thalassospira xiamenensis]|tara:strand:- start:1169 stop:2473 length:1305 start_codon:yes stop_codon:yes gene_type:complete